MTTAAADLDLALRAPADPNRRAILQSIRAEPRSVGAIAPDLGLSQQITSHHLGVIHRAGLAVGDRLALFYYLRVTDHHDEGWRLHHRDTAARALDEVLSAVINVGTALHLTTWGMTRLLRCTAGEEPGDPCTNVVVDITRNGRQRYCSVRCANRAAVRRHRARTAR